MVVLFTSKKLIDLSFILFLFKYKSNKKLMYKVNVLDSPFHYKLVKTNLYNNVYFVKITLPFYNKRFLTLLNFNSIVIEQITKTLKNKIILW